MARRQHLTLSLLLIVFLFLSLSYFFTSVPPVTVPALRPPPPPPPSQQQPNDDPHKHQDAHVAHEDADAAQRTLEAASSAASATASAPSASSTPFNIDLDDLPSLDGESMAPKMENATLKAELGRATWRFLHTMAAKFPDKPTADERKTFETFIHLFARLYPCGDCARHFRGILADFPPQTSSRSSAAGWLCHAHNLVNKRLEKPEFDCNTIGDFYDCGCAEDEKDKDKNTGGAAAADGEEGKDQGEEADKSP